MSVSNLESGVRSASTGWRRFATVVRRTAWVVVWLGASPVIAADAPSKVRSAEDGWLDISEFLDKSYGFVPLVIPITEPAVGYGAAGALVFIDRSEGEAGPGFDRPNLTAVGGLATENDTWGFLAGDVRHWRDNRVQTLVGAVYASINLDFYGVGEDSTLEDDPLSYNLEPLGGAVRAKYRFGDSQLWLGLGYALANTMITYDESSPTPGLLDLPSDSRVGGLIPTIIYDSRDNIFTPTSGTYSEGSVGVFAPALGGDDTFQRVNLTYIYYAPLHPRTTLGVKGTQPSASGTSRSTCCRTSPCAALRSCATRASTRPTSRRNCAGNSGSASVWSASRAAAWPGTTSSVSTTRSRS